MASEKLPSVALLLPLITRSTRQVLSRERSKTVYRISKFKLRYRADELLIDIVSTPQPSPSVAGVRILNLTHTRWRPCDVLAAAIRAYQRPLELIIVHQSSPAAGRAHQHSPETVRDLQS